MHPAWATTFQYCFALSARCSCFYKSSLRMATSTAAAARRRTAASSRSGSTWLTCAATCAASFSVHSAMLLARRPVAQQQLLEHLLHQTKDQQQVMTCPLRHVALCMLWPGLLFLITVSTCVVLTAHLLQIAYMHTTCLRADAL